MALKEKTYNAKLLLVIKRCIEATFDCSKWDELGLITNCADIIDPHPRLLRSMNFGDDDYGACVSSVLGEILDRDTKNKDLIVNYIGLQDWLLKAHPKDYEELFGQTHPLLDHTEKCAITNSFELSQHLARIRNAIENDPELAVGSVKEMLETVLKTIVSGFGENSEGENFPVLLKKAQKHLKLDPSDMQPSAKGADLIKRTLSNLGQVVAGINELRGIYGTGHGKIGKSGITPRHSRLVVGAGATLATFLMETFETRNTDAKGK